VTFTSRGQLPAAHPTLAGYATNKLVPVCPLARVVSCVCPRFPADSRRTDGRIPLKDLIRFKERQWFVEELEVGGSLSSCS
jgi:hypothetical protein